MASSDNLAELLLIFERDHERLLCAAFKITKNREDAEDALQNAMIKAVTCLHQFKGKSKLGTWLWSILRNMALERLRREKYYRRALSIDRDVFVMRSRESSPEQQTNCREIHRLACAEIQLHAYGYGIPEIAEIQGESEPAIKARVWRGRKALRAAAGI